MPRVPGSVPAARAELFAEFVSYLQRTGRRYVLYQEAARQFLVRWPDIEGWASLPLDDRLHGYLHPGYDFLLARRKLPSLWRELPLSPMAADVERFTSAAGELGFTERVRSGIASQVIARLLIQTGRRLAGLTDADFTDF